MTFYLSDDSVLHAGIRVTEIESQPVFTIILGSNLIREITTDNSFVNNYRSFSLLLFMLDAHFLLAFLRGLAFRGIRGSIILKCSLEIMYLSLFGSLLRMLRVTHANEASFYRESAPLRSYGLLTLTLRR